MPPSLDGDHLAHRRRSLGEQIKLALLLVVTVPWLIVVVLPALLIGMPAYRIYGRWLRMRWERTLGSRGKRILLVYSRSPHWQSYIETAWLPKLAAHAVVVDWSDRSRWPRRAPLEIRAFRYWGGRKAFNPLAVLFPARGRVRTIRFWQAFRDLKHGKDGALRTAEAELFDFLDAVRNDAA